MHRRRISASRHVQRRGRVRNRRSRAAVEDAGAAHGRGAALDRPCGGFGAEGVAVSLSPDSEKWAEKVEVKNGNIFLTVRPMGLMIICE